MSAFELIRQDRSATAQCYALRDSWTGTAVVDGMLKARPESSIITRTVHWTEFDGTKRVVWEGPYYDEEDVARKEIIWARAAAMGWTPIRWWKWWRLNDTPNPDWPHWQSLDPESKS